MEERDVVGDAACEALGRIMARSGGTADATVVTALTVLAKTGEANVRSAAVSALGRAPLSATQRSSLFNALRVNPKLDDGGA